MPGGSASVNMIACTSGRFVYTTLPGGPLSLAANTAYYLVSSESPGGDRWATSNTTITTTPVATCNGALLSNGASWTLRPPANTTFGPVNFKYQ